MPGSGYQGENCTQCISRYLENVFACLEVDIREKTVLNVQECKAREYIVFNFEYLL